MEKPQLKLFNPNPDFKTYNHALDLAFEVSGSEYEDWYECLKHEPMKVLEALIKRAENIFNSPSQEYLEAITGFDTYEEQNV